MICGDMLILEILERYPEAKEVFAQYAMPCERCMNAVYGTLAEGARMHGLSLETLAQELEERITSAGLRAREEND
jgi:hybrid cluster-associated redox disulfide protein